MSEIDSGQIVLKDLLSEEKEMWFRIPVYQRPYMWEEKQVKDLLEDIDYAIQKNLEQQYFLGSIVLQSHKNKGYLEHDLIDGQQRVITLLLLVAILLKRSVKKDTYGHYKDFILKEENESEGEPGRPRVTFQIRTDADKYIEDLVTKNPSEINTSSQNTSVQNMKKAANVIDQFFVEKSKEEHYPEKYLEFLMSHVLLIYISTEHLGDSFRLFRTLNDRGKQLRPIDILKVINLGVLKTDQDMVNYAYRWEEIENDLKSDFPDLLVWILTILVKKRAQLGLHQEYEDKIYKEGKLKEGKKTFELVKDYSGYYKKIKSGSNNDITGDYKFDNLIEIMRIDIMRKGKGVSPYFWMPPLLRYYDIFREKGLYEFLVRLDNKCSASWIIGRTPKERFKEMVGIIKEIESADDFRFVLKSEKLLLRNDEFEQLFETLDGKIYGAEFDTYILLKLDFLLRDRNERMKLGQNISIEHILPQDPKEDSQWLKDFPDDDSQTRKKLTHLLGNLILLSCSKNAALGRLDYKEKCEKYFENNISSHSNSQKALWKVETWDKGALQKNQKRCIETLEKHYRTTLKV